MQAILCAGMLTTRMTMVISFEKVGHDMLSHELVLDEELRIRRILVVMLESVFNIQPVDRRSELINEYKSKVEKLKKNHKDDPVKFHGLMCVLMAILYSSSYDIFGKSLNS